MQTPATLPPVAFRCDDCRQCHFTAPCGQPLDKAPHMQCLLFGKLPVSAEHGNYRHTLIPAHLRTDPRAARCPGLARR